MNKEKKLLKNALIIFSGKFCTQFISFILVPFYTFVLKSEEYGFVDLTTTYIGLLVPIITIQLENAMFRYLVDSRGTINDQKKVFSNILYFISKLTFMILFTYVFICLIIKFEYKIEFAFCVLATMYSNLFLQVSRGIGDNKSFAISSTIAGISNLIFNILFLLVFKFKVSGVLIATTLSNLLVIIYLFLKLKLYNYFEKKYINKDEIKKYIKYSFPLVPNGIIWWVINVSDRTLISIFLNSSANGIYAVSNKFSTIIISIYNVFNLSWTESASININSDDKDIFFTKIFNQVIKITGTISILIMMILPFMFNIIIGDNYYEAYKYIPLLLLGSFFNIIVMYLGGIYVALKKTGEVAKTSLFSGVLNILINIVLIKSIGIWAAALSTFLAFFIMSIYRFIDVRKYIKLKIDFKRVLFLIILSFIAFVLYYISDMYIKIVLFIILSVLIVFFNFNIIKKILIMIKSKLLIYKNIKKR